MLEDARGHIDYNDEGSRPTLVFVPGPWADGVCLARRDRRARRRIPRGDNEPAGLWWHKTTVRRIATIQGWIQGTLGRGVWRCGKRTRHRRTRGRSDRAHQGRYLTQSHCIPPFTDVVVGIRTVRA
jgi:hypothetical protein